jgi:superfamily II DNA/RNA helicase
MSKNVITDHQAKYYADILTRKTSSGDREKVIGAVLDAKVNPLPHQIDAALFAFRSPFSKGAILADEVGLGKTIEAGIVISQKWAEHKRNLLIIAPANLRQQWSNELQEKFHLPSIIIDSQKIKKAINEDKKLINGTNIVIVSYNFAANYQELMQSIEWDLVVFDEAHKLRNVYKSDNITANTLRQIFKNRPKLLLTATPLQNSLLELYGLVSIIDDDYFGMFDAFKDEYTNLPGGAKGQKKLEELRARLKPVVNRSLRRQVQEYIKYTNRRAFTQQFTPTPEETKLYELVTEYLAREEIYAFSSSQRTLITLLLLKLLGSSSYAISYTLSGIASRVEAEANAGVRRDKSGKKLFDQDLLDSVSEEADDDFEDVDTEHKLSPAEIEAMLIEAKELRSMSKLASSITKESKGDALLSALGKGFQELPKYNAKRKAIVFTESTRTQAYLVKLLENNGYADKVITFNGSGGTEKEALVYKDWLDKHKDTDVISGVKTSDRRAAIVDYFRDEAEIMVATEAAGEGINLQFCSMVINYDLPWNPQRVEQRIGRCHRYGQQSDVLVFNFLNSENRAEQRILQLLTEKFKLFDGVFGASDEILGVIESGFDFERNIADIILHSVRMPDQIDSEFDAIQNQFSEKIDKQRKTARQHLIDNFDSDVQEKLKIARGENKYYMDRNTELLWKTSGHVLADYAEFHDEGFTLKKVPSFIDGDIQLGTYGYSDEAKAQNRYRFNLPLAQSVLSHAKKLSPKNGEMNFYYTGSGVNIAALENFVGKSGYLKMVRYTRASNVQTEEYYLTLSVTDEGVTLKPEVASRLFDLPADFNEASVADFDIESIQRNAISNIEKDAQARDNHLLNEEFAKISSRADDLRRSARIKLKKRDAEIRQLKKDFKAETDMTKRLELQRTQILLQRRQDDEEQEYRQKSRAIDDEMLELNDTIRASVEAKPQIELLFNLRWHLK